MAATRLGAAQNVSFSPDCCCIDCGYIECGCDAGGEISDQVRITPDAAFVWSKDGCSGSFSGSADLTQSSGATGGSGDPCAYSSGIIPMPTFGDEVQITILSENIYTATVCEWIIIVSPSDCGTVTPGAWIIDGFDPCSVDQTCTLTPITTTDFSSYPSELRIRGCGCPA